jgi:thymidylate synthase (FAD)
MSNTQNQIDLQEILSQPTVPTKRTVVAGAEKHMHQLYPLLDHGFIRLVDYMGGDDSIVRAARVSYGKGTKKVSEDKGLIDYLVRHRHSTPLEMCEVIFHCKLPIFVARQWIRHRTANVNEVSARYSILDKEFYVPEAEDLAPQAKDNKQGRAGDLTQRQKLAVINLLKRNGETAYQDYEVLLGENPTPSYCDNFQNPEFNEFEEDWGGIARELARMNLSLNFYTSWYWKIDLHNLMHFLSLRLDAHAQKEIRVYAQTMWGIVQDWVPLASAAFENAQLNGAHLTGRQLDIIRMYIGANEKGDIHDYKASNLANSSHENWHAINGISKREWDELAKIIRGGK